MVQRPAVFTLVAVLLVSSFTFLGVSFLLWLGVLPTFQVDATDQPSTLSGHKSSGLSVFNRGRRAKQCVGEICPDDADAAMKALHDYYNPFVGLWKTTSWWNSANAIETTLDYSKLTGTRTYYRAVTNTFDKYKYVNFLNPWYYDDEGWWALTWIKAYDLTGEERYLDAAKTIFEDMKKGWDSTCGGGVWWLKRREYKNAITNELFLAVAARLHLRTPGDSGPGSYLDWAQRTWKWFKQRQLINKEGLVNDGLNDACRNNNDATWTYNQGVILGGLVDLHLATKDPQLLKQAEVIADATIKHLAPKGILQEWCEPDDCSADSVHFKGIFIRNLAYLHQVHPKSTYRAFILRNANSIWRYNRNDKNQLGLRWDGPFDKSDAARQSSAMDAINAALMVGDDK